MLTLYSLFFFVLVACNKQEEISSDKFFGFKHVGANKEKAVLFFDKNSIKKHNDDSVSFNMIRVVKNGYAIQNAESDCTNSFKSFESVIYRDDGSVSDDKILDETLILPSRDNPDTQNLVDKVCDQVKGITLTNRVTTKLIYKSGVAFLVDENEPFTGKYEKYYSTGEKMLETLYIKGKEAMISESLINSKLWNKDGSKLSYLILESSTTKFKNALNKAIVNSSISQINENVFVVSGLQNTLLLPNQKIYILFGACEAHNCNRHQILLLYSPEDNSFVGTYMEDSEIGYYENINGFNHWIGEKKWIGKPSEIEKLVISDYEDKTSILYKYLELNYKSKFLPEEPLPIEVLSDEEIKVRINSTWLQQKIDECKKMGGAAKYDSTCVGL